MPKSDEALLEAVRSGDDDALDALLSRHAPAVMRFATRLCRDHADAEDVLQETLLAAARGLRDFRQDASLTTWLFTVARSFCIKKRRRSVHAPDALLPLDEAVVDAAPHHAPDEAAQRQELGSAITRAIAELDEVSREVILLRDVEGLGAAEVASVLGVSVDAVKSRLHRARAALRARLEPYVNTDVPTVPSDPACPDIVDVLSRHLEGDVAEEACAAMERHVSTCSSCSAQCDSLRRALALCKTDARGALEPAAAARVRALVERVVRETR